MVEKFILVDLALKRQWRSYRGTNLGRSQKVVLLQNFDNGQMRVSGFKSVNEFTWGHWTKAKTVTSLFPQLSVLAVERFFHYAILCLCYMFCKFVVNAPELVNHQFCRSLITLFHVQILLRFAANGSAVGGVSVTRRSSRPLLSDFSEGSCCFSHKIVPVRGGYGTCFCSHGRF